MTATKEFREDFDVYRKTSAEYDQLRFTGRAGRWSHHRQVAVLLRALPNLENKQVLEIGAGTGRITLSLAQAGARVLATDISPEMLEVAKRRLAASEVSSRAEFRSLDVFDMDLDVARFDYIVMLNVLSRLTEPAEAIRNIARRMSRCARFVFTFNCLTSVLFPFALLVNARGRSLSRDVTSRWHTPAGVAAQCAQAGLEVTQWHGNHYVPAPRKLFLALPAFWLCDLLISRRFPRLSPSVFAVTRLADDNRRRG